MTYHEALEYLYQKLPAFHRLGKKAYKADLHNTLALCEVVGNPHQKFRSIHVAGTNGKGSVSHLLASVFQEAGYRTGLYTSPHLKNFTERIKLNGIPISEEYIAQFIQKYYPEIERIQPSFFETTVALAFHFFASQQVDIAVIEVGMGGRLDSTNVITPLLSIITNISFDHMEFLGDTLPKIAAEKAGIIKPKVPVLISEQQTETIAVFEQKAHEQNAPLFWAKDFYEVSAREYASNGNLLLNTQKLQDNLFDFLTLESSLAGRYQVYNVRAVLSAMAIFKEFYPDFTIQPIHIQQGIKNCVVNTQLKGRWQILAQSPLTIADVAHNEGGVKVVLEQIKHLNYKQLHIVWGMVNDKEPLLVLSLLPKTARYYFTQAISNPRALDKHQLQTIAQRFGLCGETYENVNIALQTAQNQADTQDLIIVMGSIFLIGELDCL
ncbi:MAG: bifunctional folylpolyglutamate synthase/dihydrofolate synthase [Microscillaceae bacterium]|nr:bifunctional folylpolyglutamate synthase/dihydrofolate synthase [Microscillaceae bacterium]MDW8459576.1 folylpolyglutamate synthase/dihydrofolate synthase family protein [Cytophagales bacterium]